MVGQSHCRTLCLVYKGVQQRRHQQLDQTQRGQEGRSCRVSPNPEDPKHPAQLDAQAGETLQRQGPKVHLCREGPQLSSQVGSISNSPEWFEEGELWDKAVLT